MAEVFLQLRKKIEVMQGTHLKHLTIHPGRETLFWTLRRTFQIFGHCKLSKSSHINHNEGELSHAKSR